MERIFNKNKKILSILFALIIAFGTVTAVPFITGTAVDISGGDGDNSAGANVDSAAAFRLNTLTDLSGGDGDNSAESNVDSAAAFRLNALTGLSGGDGDNAAEANVDSAAAFRLNALTGLSGGDGDNSAEANADSAVAFGLNALTGLSGGDGDNSAEANVDSAIAFGLNALTGLSGGDGDNSAEANVDSTVTFRLNTLTGLSGGDGDNTAEANVDSAITFRLNPSVSLSGGDGDNANEANVDSYAEYILLNVIDVTADPVEGGSVTGGGEYDYGDEVTVSAMPAEGYRFVNWTENGTEVSTDADYTFTATQSRELTANFIPVYTVRFENYDGTELQTGEAVSGDIPSYGGETPEKPAADGYTYTFAGWDDGSGIVYPAGDELPAVDGDVTYTAVFTSEAITYSIRFISDINASDAYDEYSVNEGAQITAPETDPSMDGYVFSGWYVRDTDNYTWIEDDDGSPEVVVPGENPDDYELISLASLVTDWEGTGADAYMRQWDFENDTAGEDTVLYAKWIVSGGLPEFDSHALVLSGEIGVIFNVSVPEGFDTSGMKMTFTVGKNGSAEMAVEDAIHDPATDIYGFVCYVGTYNMADVITPTLIYYLDAQETAVEGEPYSTADYIEFVRNNSSLFEENVVNLVEALADYGHFAQVYLSRIHNFSEGNGEGDKYALVDCSNTLSYDYDEVRNADEFTDRTFVKSFDEDKVNSLSYSLDLESTTNLYLYLDVKSGVVPDEATLADGTVLPIMKRSKNLYRVSIKGIKASELGNDFSITVKQGGETIAEATVSPMSYIATVLNAESGSLTQADIRDAVCSIYYYYKAAQALTQP